MKHYRSRRAVSVTTEARRRRFFPDKVASLRRRGRGAYLSTVADKLMASDGSRTTAWEPNSAQE